VKVSEPLLLDLSRSLYDLGAVESTATTFVELDTIVVEASEHHILVRISDPHPGLADLADHFANHALHATVLARRQAAEVTP
jgi:hypothetical protein